MRTILRGPVVLAVALLLTAGCSGGGKKATPTASGSSTTTAPDDRTTPGPTTSPATASTSALGATVPIAKLGTRLDTAKGTVIVFTYESPASPPDTTPRPGNRFVDIDAEGCAGPNADPKTGIGPVNFYLQIGRYAYRPIAAAKAPAMRPTQLNPGSCTRGWMTFEIPEAAKPPYVYFSSSKVLAWQLP